MANDKLEIIEKTNTLNEIRNRGMDLQQLRIFSIFLAKINLKDNDPLKVTFSLQDLQKIMGFEKINIKQVQEVTDGLLCKIYNQTDENGGYKGFPLFKNCTVFKKEFEDWFIEIEASDDAAFLLSDIKHRYFKYKLWNALRLKSSNQVIIYELLKKHENEGILEISLAELRERLDLVSEYSRWNNFKVRVLESCQLALKEMTDICFTYKRGESGSNGKWLSIIFEIYKNDNYEDELELDRFIDLKETMKF